MKWRLAVFLLLLYTCFTFLISLAITIGRQFPREDNHMLAQSEACSLPCLLGIIPGQTSRAEALAILTPIADYPLDQMGVSFGFNIPDEQESFITGLLIFDDEDRVQYVRLYTRRWAGLGIRLGDLMGETPPTDVYRSCSNAYPVRLVLTYNGSPQISYAAVVEDSVSLQSPVSMIAVSAQEEMFAQTLASVVSGGCHIPSEWHGFGSVWLYDRPAFSLP